MDFGWQDVSAPLFRPAFSCALWRLLLLLLRPPHPAVGGSAAAVLRLACCLLRQPLAERGHVWHGPSINSPASWLPVPSMTSGCGTAVVKICPALLPAAGGRQQEADGAAQEAAEEGQARQLW